MLPAPPRAVRLRATRFGETRLRQGFGEARLRQGFGEASSVVLIRVNLCESVVKKTPCASVVNNIRG